MTGSALANAYLRKARARLQILDVLFGNGDYSDVVREAQEAVELATKAVLHQIGIDPPRWHDVGPLLAEYRGRLPAGAAEAVDAIALISRRLRKERELAFYGDVDFIPTEAYGPDEARRAMDDAQQVIAWAEGCLEAR